jgi:hypothetical protein
MIMFKKIGALALLGVALSMSAPADAEAGRLKRFIKNGAKDAAFAVIWTGSCAADKILKGKKGAFC